jgi:hypothetical protein
MSDYTSRLAPLAGNDLPTYQDPISKGIGNFLVRSAADIGKPILDMYNAPSFGKFFEAAGPAMVAAASPVAAEGKVATKAAGEALETILGRAEQWATPEVKPQGILAYHGSPYDFEKFDTSKIGTGEGAQAYGHGLYFAGNEGVATQYRNKLAERPEVLVGGQPVNQATGFDRSGGADSIVAGDQARRLCTPAWGLSWRA